MKTLNRKQPFGEVCGDMEGRRYHQDGVYFDDDGNELVDPNAPVKKPAAATKTKSNPAIAAAAGGDDQVGAQLGAQ